MDDIRRDHIIFPGEKVGWSQGPACFRMRSGAILRRFKFGEVALSGIPSGQCSNMYRFLKVLLFLGGRARASCLGLWRSIRMIDFQVRMSGGCEVLGWDSSGRSR